MYRVLPSGERPDEIIFHYYHEPYGRYWEMARRRVRPIPWSPIPFIAAFRYPDPLGRLSLAAMRECFDGTWRNHSMLLPQRLSEERPELIRVEPIRSFYKHTWTREGIRTLLEDLDTDFDAVLSIHLWSHVWWSRGRRDFSRLHTGSLTDRYVRRMDTTGGVAARRFLPSPLGLAERTRWRALALLRWPARRPAG